MKKLLLSFGAIAMVLVAMPMFAAFEAHVINVTATIENALSVSTKDIQFGTVFPQEIMKESLTIQLSQSFMAEDRADDVNYVIKQKPKVKGDNPYEIIYPETYLEGIVAHEYCLNELGNLVDPGDLSDEYYQYCYPNLSPYLSKHKAEDDKTMLTDTCDEPYAFDCEVDAPNPNWDTVHATGHLVQSANDEIDKWVIDLVVPCFSGSCDQTYDSLIWGTQLDPRLEGEVFGTDLWIEVVGVSENHAQCGDDIDNDGDGLIDFDGNGDLTLVDPGCTNAFDTTEDTENLIE